MKVAIVGAGFAGLAVCWHLYQYPNVQATLFDGRGIGRGASGVSAGLLHPFPGRHARRAWMSHEGIDASLHLLSVAEAALGRAVAKRNGVFRPAITAQQKENFAACAKEHSDAMWQHDARFGWGLWVASGISVYSSLYIQGLWQACHALGSLFVPESITCLEDLASFDRVILAPGSETLSFDLCKGLPVKAVKGQTLLCRLLEPLPFSMVSNGYITCTEDPHLCQLGSTYERGYTTTDPDPLVALQLKEKVGLFYPDAFRLEVMEIRAGVRLSPRQGSRPLMRRLDEKTWLFTGLGSKGLLYHALFGKALAACIAQGLLMKNT